MHPWLGDHREEWLIEVTDWINRTVVSVGLGAVVDVTSVRERQWGAVLRVTTSERVVYVKAGGLGAHHEIPVLAELARVSADFVPVVLAADPERSWLMMADHGRPVWEVLDAAGQTATLERLLPRYADLQRSSAAAVERWIRAGVPDRRVGVLPELLASLLAGEMAGGALPLDAEQRHAIDLVLPDFAHVCAELATTPYAEALDHGDLHGGNVLVDGAGCAAPIRR